MEAAALRMDEPDAASNRCDDNGGVAYCWGMDDVNRFDADAVTGVTALQ